MRILYLNPCGQMGGAETSLVELLASVRRLQPDWDLRLLLGESGPLSAYAERLGVRVIEAPFPRAIATFGDSALKTRRNGAGKLRFAGQLIRMLPQVRGYERKLNGVIAALAPDLIHATGFKMQILGLRASGDIPVIWHIHDFVGTRPIVKRLMAWHARRCAGILVNSRAVEADVRAACPAAASVRTVYNAIDLERFAPDGAIADLDALAGLPPAEPGVIRIGLVATFARWKGHEVFLRAVAKAAVTRPLRAYIIGAPIYQTGGSQYTLQELKDVAAGLNLTGKVGFTGFIEDTARAMRALDIVVHASTRPEPFGMVIAEGMACGRAVIASCAGGAREIFEDGGDALSHPPGDADALAVRIAHLAGSAEVRARFGKTGRRAAQQRFNRDRLGGELLAAYRAILSNTAVCAV